MTDIMAAMGLVQLKRYKSMLSRRHELIQMYDDAFSKLNVKLLRHTDSGNISSGHLYLVRVNGISPEQRNDIIIKMGERGIACNVHYKPLPMLTAYKNLGFDIKDYPNAYHQFANEITLPLYSKLTDSQAEYIISNFTDILSNL